MRSFEEQRTENVLKMIKYAKIFVVFLIIVSLVSSVFGTIDAGERGVKTRLGKVVGTLDSGLYFKLPFIEKVTKINVQTASLIADNSTSPALSAASYDLQDVSVSAIVNYHIDPSPLTVLSIYTQYGSAESYYDRVVNPLLYATIKSAVAQYTAAEQIQKRSEMTSKVLFDIQEAFKDKNVIIEKVDITDISFSASFTKSIEEKVTAVQNAETQKNKLEQVKYEAQQKIETAKAEAEAIRISAQAINSQGGEDYVKLKAIEKWSGQGCTSYCGLEASSGLLINTR